ncbi:MAG TPA: hypothetical protein VLM42_02030 [Bryobacteraceae bacterium]|nr:hypothetical protein [Bryobacteraceae bacterium]
MPRKASLSLELLTATLCLYFCWHAVSWALQPGLFMILDEIGNLHMFPVGLTWNSITILPHFAYNDRPVGFALERWWFEIFAFDYRSQLLCLLSIHFANLLLAFFLMRRIGASALATLAALCAFATLSTTAQTATYIGAIFDVLCLFFILATTLAFLSKKPGAAAFSALLFFLALRTKEFAIVLPVLLLAIAYYERTLRRLWIHLSIWAVFLIQYALLIRRMIPSTPAGNPYTIHADPRTILTSFLYFTSLIFHEEAHPRRAAAILLLVGAMALYAAYRRRGWIVWNLAAYALTLLPVTIIPGNRAQFYVYAPALFLLFAAALTLEDLIGLLTTNQRTRWVTVAAATAVVLLSVVLFQKGPYFKNRIAFTLFQRRSAQRTASDLTTLLPHLAPDSQLLLYQGGNVSWLLFPGPCDYLNLPLRRQAYNCILSNTPDDARQQYAAQKPPKYYLVYSADGSLRLGDGGP